MYFTIKECVICDGEKETRIDISSPIEVHEGDRVKVSIVPGAALLEVDWYRGWVSGRWTVSAPMPNPECKWNTARFVLDPSE